MGNLRTIYRGYVVLIFSEFAFLGISRGTDQPRPTDTGKPSSGGSRLVGQGSDKGQERNR
jgi:hypothetical protein